MVKHYIIMSSSYKKGKRIAINFNNEKNITEDFMKKQIEKIIEKCGRNAAISTHFIQTESTSWESVVQADSFFKEVYLTKDIKEFIQLINGDRDLEGIDVAKYILSRIKCTHLKLEKLVYMCYAEYLCNTEKNLFEDKIYAFRYGPVIDSVYEQYKVYGHSEISEGQSDLRPEADDKEAIESLEQYKMAIRSRILFAEDGLEKLKTIEDTIEKYDKYTANELVNITHKGETPWQIAFDGGAYTEISKKIIFEYHCNEIV